MADGANVNRQLSVYKHRKKQASNDAQLLMNRIALLQKEEERARKKIDDTKDRASEIITMRGENEKRMKDYLSAGNAEQHMREELQRKVKEKDAASRKARAEVHGNILYKRREDAANLQGQKKQLTKFMLKEQEKELRLKQKKRDEVRAREEAAKAKRQAEKEERERKTREMYERKAKEEEAEARRAEKLVKELERREREWIEKLREAQNIQEFAFEELEDALLKGPAASMSMNSGSPHSKVSSSAGKKRMSKK
eukprot:GSChrysophyteH1.ASY1.ANO1.640.1 assembled CDS